MTKTTATGAVPERAETAATTRDEIRLQGKLALPLIATYVAELCMWYIDQAIVGRLGGLELGAVGLAGLLFWELIFIAMAFLAIVAVIIGNAHGAGDASLVGRGMRQGLWLAVLLSVPVMVLGWFLMDLLAFTGQDPGVIALGEEYLHASVWVVPPTLGLVALRSFVVGVSRPMIITAIVVLTLPVNFVLTFLLVFGGLGIPAMGVAGAGYATSIAGWLSFLALRGYIYRDPRFRQYRLFHELLRFDRELSRYIWRLGLPVAVSTVVEGSLFQVMTVIVGVFGALTLAAHQVVINAVSLGVMIALGLAEAAAVRVSQEMGAGRKAAARRAGWIAVVGGVVIGAASAIALCLTPDQVAGVFLNLEDPLNTPVLEMTRTLAIIGAVMVIVDAVNIIVTRCLRGLHDTFVPMLIAGVGSWLVAMPLGAFLAFGLDLGAADLWWGMSLGIAATCLLMLGRWYALSRMTSDA